MDGVAASAMQQMDHLNCILVRLFQEVMLTSATID
jgi:hypothetical protein